MSWTEIRERNESASKGGRRVTKMIREAKELLEEICEAAEEMEQDFGRRGHEDKDWNDDEMYGERESGRMRGVRGRNSRY